MSPSRIAALTIFALAVITAADCRRDSRAQGTSGTTQNILPDGTVIFGNSGSTTVIFPDGSIVKDGVAVTGEDEPERTASLPTLKSGLDVAVWDAGRRGPLIAVSPESVLPARHTATRKMPFTPLRPPELLPGGRYRVLDLTDFFGRRLVRLRGISVLAPVEMLVLNTKPGKPDYFAGLPRNEKLQILQASLTAAQWKLLGGEAGLGANDLSAKQKELFVSSLPDPMVIHKQRSAGLYTWSAVSGDKPVILSGSQRNAIRLRVNRVAQFSVPFQGEGSSNSGYAISGDAVGTEYASVNSYDLIDGSTLFGQHIRMTVPNHLKPQQIDFAAPALQAGISLVGLKTVGDLIERIRTTTHTEIYVSEAVAKRNLWIRSGDTQTVRAGDALQALCWSTTGAVRYVSDSGSGDRPSGVFILTEDLEGIGSRLTRIKDWEQAAQKHVMQTQIASQNAIRKQQPVQYIKFAPGDSNVLEAKANKAVEDSWKTTQGRWQGTAMPLTDLSPRQQEIIRQGIVSYDKSPLPYPYDGERRHLANNGMVSVSVRTRSTLIVPGVGEVRDSSSSGFFSFVSLDTMLPPPASVAPVPAESGPKIPDTASIPASLPLGGVFCVSPSTEEEARQVIRAASERGLKQVWLVLPLIPAVVSDRAASVEKSKALLTAAVLEAQKATPPVKIVAGVRLFRLPLPSESAPPLKEQDVTITGELPSEMAKRRAAYHIAAQAAPASPQVTYPQTYDWIAPETVGLTARIIRRLSEIAAVPGVSGIALLDTSPPGYSLPNRAPFYGENEGSTNVGYTPSSRAAFIRSAGSDPIDVMDVTPSISVGYSMVHLPFFDSGTVPTSKNAAWNRFRSNLLAGVLADLYTPLMASLPKPEGGFPVYLQNLDTASAGGGWFSRWENKEALPRRTTAELQQSQNTYQVAQRVSTVSLIDMRYRNEPPAQSQAPLLPPTEPIAPAVQYARRLNSVLTGSKGAWAGLVLNFSDVSVDRALELVQGITPPEKAPPVRSSSMVTTGSR